MAAPSKDFVIVDGRGQGDVSTIAAGLLQIRVGGIIRVKPGRYSETIEITKSVSIVGDPDSPPVFEGSIISKGASVTISGMKIEGAHQGGTVRVDLGNLQLVNCFVTNHGGVAQDNMMTAAVSVSDGTLDIDRCVVGPGRDAAILVSGSGKLFASRANVVGGTGYGVYAADESEINVSVSTVSGSSALVATARSKLKVAVTTLIGTHGEPVVSVFGKATADIVYNEVAVSGDGKLTVPADRKWFHVAATVPCDHLKIIGNTTGRGRGLPAPKCEYPSSAR